MRGWRAVARQQGMAGGGAAAERERRGLRGKKPLAYRRRELGETVVRIGVDVVFLISVEAAVERIRF